MCIIGGWAARIAAALLRKRNAAVGHSPSATPPIRFLTAAIAIVLVAVFGFSSLFVGTDPLFSMGRFSIIPNATPLACTAFAESFMGGTAEPALTIYLRQPNSAALDPTPLRVWPTQSVSTPATLEVE